MTKRHGDDPETQAQQVIDDAARLAGWLWTAAAAVPAPPAVVHAVKVVLHSAIEIRMVGELYAIFANTVPSRDATWLGSVLVAWANRQPLAPGGTVTSGAAVLVTRIRRSIIDLVGDGSRLAGLANRGREGFTAVRRLGGRLHRRMRLHPSNLGACRLAYDHLHGLEP